MSIQDISATEYAPYYATYLQQVPAGNLLDVYAQSAKDTEQFFGAIPADKQVYAYAPGKWTISEVLQHIIDVERMFGGRLLRIARGDQTPIPGFEQNDYAAAAVPGDHQRAYSEMVAEYELLKRANLLMMKGMPPEVWSNLGTASGNPVSARALLAMMIGHERHHLAITKERYL